MTTRNLGRMKSFEDVREAFRQVPVNRFLGFQLVSRSNDEAVVTMEVSSEHAQETGIVHGALLTAVADTASVYVFCPDLSEGSTMASIEFKMNFLRPARIGAGHVHARAKVVRRGRKIGVCEVELKQSDALVAKGLFTYLFWKRTESSDLASSLTTG